jgi:hypothetical protein
MDLSVLSTHPAPMVLSCPHLTRLQKLELLLDGYHLALGHDNRLSLVAP